MQIKTKHDRFSLLTSISEICIQFASFWCITTSTLSASQRDKLLIEESKEDSTFKNDLVEALRLSSESFAQSLEQVGKSMVDVGNGMCKSIEILAKTMIAQPQPVHPQYMQTQPIPTNIL